MTGGWLGGDCHPPCMSLLGAGGLAAMENNAGAAACLPSKNSIRLAEM